MYRVYCHTFNTTGSEINDDSNCAIAKCISYIKMRKTTENDRRGIPTHTTKVAPQTARPSCPNYETLLHGYTFSTILLRIIMPAVYTNSSYDTLHKSKEPVDSDRQLYICSQLLTEDEKNILKANLVYMFELQFTNAIFAHPQ